MSRKVHSSVETETERMRDAQTPGQLNEARQRRNRVIATASTPQKRWFGAAVLVCLVILVFRSGK